MDYRKLNFKCGLEIHQQLSGEKLFCNCPTITNKKEAPDFIFKRNLHASTSELGIKDIAAEFEQEKNKTFIYEVYKDCNCLVELDEEPPHPINQEALHTALQLSLILKANIVNEIQVMRKVVIDGSNVSGFQRTALIALNGKLETSQGTISIPTICLEEEAAKKIKTNGNEVTYRLDRLGIPLIEIATGPEIKNPEHAKETASLLGSILRSLSNIKRGLGSIRQDINLSINNQQRVELKGFQDLRSIPKTIELEVNRLIKTPSKSEVRKVMPDFSSSYLRPIPGSGRMYPETDIPGIKITQEELKKIKIPKLIHEESSDLEDKYKIQEHLAKEIINKKIPIEFYIKKYQNIQPSTIALILIEIPKEIKSRLKLDTEKLNKNNFEFVLEALNNNKINQEAVINILSELITSGKTDLSKYKKSSTEDIEKEITLIIKNNPELSINAIMGMIMSKHRGKVEGKTVIELIQKHKK